jgi:23S rRNA pseudouridine1911/1915/1917 synthase|tara:strand:+ start:311 stop:1354 length:1044 start_codon:yes stop_codon:yes gene_type:complete
MSDTSQALIEEELFEHFRIIIDPKQGPVRIDKFLMEKLPDLTRNKIQELIKSGWITVNLEVVKSNYKVRPNNELVVLMPEPQREEEIIAEDLPLDIRFEDPELLIVHKPAGMVVHPAYKNWSGTLVNALLWHFKKLPEMRGNEGRPGLVHRIDKDTSGLLVIAKSEKAMKGLAKQFYDHSIERTYYALVWGEPVPTQGTIDVQLGRSFKDRRLTTAFPDGDFGRRAVTHYKTLQSFRYVSLIQCNLETGRTHQIRAHMKYIGHPIFNDVTYGGDQILKGTLFTKYKQFVQNCFKIMPRQALHAKTLGFVHPLTKEAVRLDSDLPTDFTEVLAKWERYVNYIEDSDDQ